MRYQLTPIRWHHPKTTNNQGQKDAEKNRSLSTVGMNVIGTGTEETVVRFLKKIKV